MLATYQTQVQRLLHDPQAQYWPLAELTDYINEARNRVAQDTYCLRQLVTGIALTAGTEVYVPQTLLGPTIGAQLVAVLGITVYWGAERIKLYYMPFTKFDARYRRYVPFQQRPETFSRQGTNNVWIGPNPDQAYITDWDVCVVPNALVSDSTPEQIAVPFQEPIKYYAAYLAKWKEQAQGEAALFQQQYTATLQRCAVAYQKFVYPNAYRIGA